MAITDLTGTKWLLNSMVTSWANTGSPLGTINIDFVSNGTNYTSFDGTVRMNAQEDFDTDIKYNNIKVYRDPAGWLDVSYRTIEITGGAGATDTVFINWLESYGTLTPPAPTGYEVTFVTNGGTSVTKLENVEELPTPLPTTTKTNNIFVGWYYDNGLTQRAYAGETITANVTLYAKWYANMEDFYEDVADAIREKDGTTEPIKHLDFPERILAIYSGIGVSDELSLVEGTLTIDSITSSTMTFISGTLTID